MNLTNACHILVPTDFAAPSGVAKRTAVAWAAETGSRVTVLHVADGPPSAKSTFGPDAFSFLRPGNAVEQTRRRMLEALAQLHPEVRDAVDLRVAWRCGDPLAEAVRYAREEAVDLIVVGASPWWLPAGLSLGRKLAKRAHCPVIVAHGVGDSADTPRTLAAGALR